MATFTQLDDGDVAALARAFGLGEVRAWGVIEAGTINSNFALETEGGRFFLRINEGKAEADVVYEATLVEKLAAAGVPTPLPVAATDGRRYAAHGDRFASLFAWADGGHRDLGEVSVADAAAVGDALARMHLAGLPLMGELDRAGIYTFDKIVERYRGFADSDDPELGLAIDDIAAEIEWLQARAHVRGVASRGIIHGDLFRDNVMFRGEELVALIDFEQASTGSMVYDLAVCLNAWCYLERLLDPQCRAMIRAYQAVRPLTAADREALYVEARAAAMRFCVTRITDVYLPGHDSPSKDFRRYHARLLAWRGLGADKLAAWM